MANLLIVDDQESILRTFQRHFRDNVGWQVEVARDGLEAIDCLRRKRTYYDGIILDKNMPEANGDTVVKWMYEQELLDEICVVLFTGYPEMESAIDALRMGAWQYLVKEMTPTQVQTFIAPGIAQKLIYRIRRDIWSEEDLTSVLGRIQKVVQDTIAPDSFHVIFLSSFLSRDLSDGTTPSPNRIFVEKIKSGAHFLSERSRSEVAKLEPVLADAGTLMAVPVRVHRGVLGVLVMESRHEDAFDPRWKDVLAYFAEIISLAQFIHEQRQAAKVDEMIRTNGELHHRFANSLGIIGQSARELKREELTELGREHVGYIASHVSRLEDVLAELKSLSTARPVAPGNTNIAPVVYQAADELRACDSRVRVDVTGPTYVMAWADRDELHEALTCLIKNAFDAIEERQNKEANPAEGPRISITLTEGEAGVEIVVADNGIGFGEDVHARLFNALFSTKSRRGKVSEGYGLYTSQRVVKDMGGSIEAFSGGAYCGAAFTIRLAKGRM